jgi:hypothetical protein
VEVVPLSQRCFVRVEKEVEDRTFEISFSVGSLMLPSKQAIAIAFGTKNQVDRAYIAEAERV